MAAVTKVSQTRLFTKAEIYCLAFLEAGRNPGVSRAYSLKAIGGIYSLPFLLASGVLSQPGMPWLVDTALPSLLPSSRGHCLPSVCTWLSSYQDTGRMGSEPILPQQQPHFQIRSPSKIMERTIVLGEHCLTLYMVLEAGFPGGSDSKESACNEGDDPWVVKIPWKRKWQPTLVFLPGKSLGQRSLVGYSPKDRRVGYD